MSAPTPHRHERPQVLLIDDSPFDRRLLAGHLASEALDLSEAEDGPTGLARAREIQPDLILLDLTMPGWDGFETLIRLKDDPIASASPVIFLSAATSTEAKAHGLELGAVDYVGKPFDSVELRARVRVGLRLKFLLDTLEREAQIDGLTELGNRQALETWLARWQHAERDAAIPPDLSVVLLDLDHFKAINDTHGHPAGDDVLREVASTLQNASREGDFVGRLGGEEFVILAPNCSLAGALALGERLRLGIATAPVKIGGQKVALTASVGVAARGGSGASIEALLQEADQALAAAKQAGRDMTLAWDRAAGRAADSVPLAEPRADGSPRADDPPEWKWRPRVIDGDFGPEEIIRGDSAAEPPLSTDEGGFLDEPGNRRILVIDDSELDRRILKARLNLEGVEIFETADAIAGLGAAKSVRPDLILLDLLLPGMNGYQTIKHLKNDRGTKSVPVIFLSSEGTTQARALGLDLGAVDFITKPFDAVELRARVRAALRTKRMQDMLERRAKIDNLTGLANRQALNRRYRELRSSSAMQSLALVMVDLDGFKGINETYGHAAGDEVLRRMADILRSVVRPGDLAARYGGEEFTLLMPEATMDEAVERAECARRALAAAPVSFNRRAIPVTASFGVSAVCPAPGSGPSQDLIEWSDAALYAAKKAGRDAVWSWDGGAAPPSCRTPRDRGSAALA